MTLISKKFAKDGNYHTKFQEMVKNLDSKSETAKLESCALSFQESFGDYTKIELLQNPIKKDADQFLIYLIPKVSKLLSKNKKNDILFHCLATISCFLPTKKNIVDQICQLSIQIFSCNLGNVLSFEDADTILQNLTQDKKASEKTIKSNFMEIYGIGKSIGPPVSEIAFRFLKECILRSKLSPQNPIIEMVHENFSLNSNEHLCLISAICKIVNNPPDFNNINQQIRNINNCSCYEYLYGFSEAKSKFLELCNNVKNENLGKSLIEFYINHQDISLDPLILLPFLERIDHKMQSTFYRLFLQSNNDKVAILDYFIPPWRYNADCNFVLKYIIDTCDKKQTINILKSIIETNEKDKFDTSFSSMPNFSKLIIELFKIVQDDDIFVILFSDFLRFVCTRSNNSIDCFLSLLSAIEPVKYKDILITFFPELISSEYFVKNLPRLLLDVPLLSHYFLCQDILITSINNGLIDFIAVLAQDGPHNEIDKAFISTFSKSKLKNLSDEQLNKLARGFVQDSDVEEGSIKIPALIPYIKNLNLTSLFDRFAAGKYMIKNNLIKNNDSLITSVGVQYLTAKMASSLINNPYVLYEITDPTYPHHSVYQIEPKRDKSYILVCTLQFSFSFRIEHFTNPTTILEIITPAIIFNSPNTIQIGDSNFKCEVGKWHKLFITLNTNGTCDVSYDSKYKTTIKKIGPAVIGSKLKSNGSTFYVKSPLKFEAQLEPGIIYTDYKGFYYHAPMINAIPRLLQCIFESTEAKEFQEYFKVMLNIKKYNGNSPSHINIMAFLRQALVIKKEFVNEELIQLLLTDIAINGEINWHLFKNAFIDYKLWINCYEYLQPVCLFLQNFLIIQAPDKMVLSTLSLYHFFMDLELFFYTSMKNDKKEDNEKLVAISDLVFAVLMTLEQFEDDKMSSSVIHILNQNPPNIICKMIEKNSSLLDYVPLEYICYLPQKFAILFLKQYSIRCLNNEKLFNFEKLYNLIYYFQAFVLIDDFWISILTLLCRQSHSSLYKYRSSKVFRPSMFKIIFILICIFYKIDSNNLKLEVLTDIIESIISDKINANIDMSICIDQIRLLSHLGILSEVDELFPIYFNTQFKPSRKPETPSKINKKTQLNSDIIPLQNIDPSIFLQGKDLWFGFDFSQSCIEEISTFSHEEQILTSKYQDTLTNFYSIKNQPAINMKIGIFEIILRIITSSLMRMNQGKLDLYLNNLLVLGSNVDSTHSIKVQQEVILSLLKVGNSFNEILPFIKMMVVAGWWESRLPELFGGLCISCQRFSSNLINWQNLADIFKCILTLTADYSSIPFCSFPNICFSPKILGHLPNLMFYFHIFLSKDSSFLLMAPLRIRDVWMSFLIQLQETDVTQFCNLLMPNQSNTPSQIVQFIMNIAISSTFFKNPNIQNSNFIKLLRDKSKQYYQSFVDQIKSKMNIFYSILENLRFQNSIKNPVNTLQLMQTKFDFWVRKIENSCVLTRFNIISSRNECESYKIWSLIPDISHTKFQIASSAHPLSVPSLLVPFYSGNKSPNVPNINSTSDIFMNLSKNLNGVKFDMTKVPKSVNQFVIQPFIQMLSKKTLYSIFKASFNGYGKTLDIDQIFLIVGHVPIQSVLLTCSKGFYIILETSVSVDSNLQSKFFNFDFESKFPESSHMIIENCTFGYYGTCQLFFGHIVLSFSNEDIIAFCPRKFLLPNDISKQPEAYNAMEIWFTKGYSLYLKFLSPNDCSKISQKISPRSNIPSFTSIFSYFFSQKITKNFLQNSSLHEFTNQWVENKLSTFAYLLILNFYANRSFSTASQYPVFPWIQAERQLSKPIGQQNDERGKKFAKKYDELEDHFLYFQFYSSPLIVFHYLVRIQPYSTFFLEYNGKYEDENRSFMSIDDEWLLASKQSDSNIEELIPELFILPEMLLNINNEDFPGFNNCKLPKNEINYVSFTERLRKDLNLNQNIDKWIDLIFGEKSRGQQAILALNVFHPTVYGQLSKYVTNHHELQKHMADLGSAPTQLFTVKHPERNTIKYRRMKLLTQYNSHNEKPLQQEIFIAVENDTDYVDIDEETGFIRAINKKNEFFASFKEKVQINDGVFKWVLHQPDFISNLLAFSPDRTLLAIGCGSNYGTILIFKVLNDNRSTSNFKFEPLTTCFLPSTIFDKFEHFEISAIAVSSNNNLVVEAVESTIITFHISSSKFIRTIQCKYTINFMQISDSFKFIIAFGEKSIEAFTINGSKVASIDFSQKEATSNKITFGKITGASIANNDDELIISTCHEGNLIVFWQCNFDESNFYPVNTITCNDNNQIKLIKLYKKGGALLVLMKTGFSHIYAISGIGEKIVPAQFVSSCSLCQQSSKNSKMYECQYCHLFFCNRCGKTTDSLSICQRCIDNIEQTKI